MKIKMKLNSLIPTFMAIALLSLGMSHSAYASKWDAKMTPEEVEAVLDKKFEEGVTHQKGLTLA